LLCAMDADPIYPAVVDLALEVYQETALQQCALDILRVGTVKTKESCKAIVDVAKGSKGWGYAFQTAFSVKGNACKGEFDALTDAAVAHLEKVDEVSGADLLYLRNFASAEGLSKDHKAKISKAAQEVAKKSNAAVIQNGATELVNATK
jgi:hypothetical protein